MSTRLTRTHVNDEYKKQDVKSVKTSNPCYSKLAKAKQLALKAVIASGIGLVDSPLTKDLTSRSGAFAFVLLSFKLLAGNPLGSGK